MERLLHELGNACYVALALDALWGAFCVVMLWRRVANTRFKTEEEQSDFLDQVEASVSDSNALSELCEGDSRALPQLILLAFERRAHGFAKIKEAVIERFRRDVLADLDFRISWINSVIKSAPMLGLLGTVIGMMEAFHKLSQGQNIDPTQLAGSISVALITTFLGLSIAIPLTLIMTGINVRIRKMEELAGLGFSRFFEILKAAVA